MAETIIFDSASLYLESCKSNREKIIAIDKIIDALFLAAAAAAAGDHITEYAVDDGQIKIKTVYRGVTGIAKSIMEYQKLRELYKSKISGRNIRLTDSRNFT